MSKKIIHIIIGLNIGGAELMLRRLVLHSQKENNFEHCIISLTDLGIIGLELQDKNIRVYSLGMSSILSIPKTIYKLRKLIREIEPDVVQTWMYHADFLGGLAAKSIGIKNIVWGVRTTDVSQGSSRLTFYLSKTCAKLSQYIPNTIICAAQVSRDHHISIGYDKTKMIVIPNGFELDLIVASKEDRLSIRKENNLSSSDIVIGSVGRFNAVKNQKLLVDVAAILIKKFPELKFMMVGRKNDTNNKELMFWIEQHGLENNFRLLGERQGIPRYLIAMDIFCLHSKTEGFPNVLVEAMASGLPCVSTIVGDSKYILKDFGITVPPNDAQALANGIANTIEKISQNEFEIESFRLLSRDYISKNFSIERIEELYSKVWNG